MENITPSSPPSTPRPVEPKNDKPVGLFTGESQRNITRIDSNLVPPKTIPKTPGPEVKDRKVTEETPKKEDSLKEAKEALIARIKDPNSPISPEIRKKVELICRRELSEATIHGINSALSAKNNAYIDAVLFRPFRDKIDNIPTSPTKHKASIN